MPAYLGSKQLFRNRISTNPIREIYLGSKKIMGFQNANYSADEITAKPLSNSKILPKISGTGSIINVSTNDYTSGFAYSKFYCDHLEYNMMYSGDCFVYDSSGNKIISVECTDSFSFASGKWTLTCKVTMFGTQVLNDSHSSSQIDGARLAVKLFYDHANKQWVFQRAGVEKRSEVTEWQPTYFSVSPRMWFIISTYDSMFFDGIISITNMNKAVGYPQATS